MSVCTKGFAYQLCRPRGRGIGLVCLFGRLFLPTTFTHTHDPRPLPTTHDIQVHSIYTLHYIYITLIKARSIIFMPAAILRVALSWPPRKPTVFARLARWQRVCIMVVGRGSWVQVVGRGCG